jgi:hypothetical protein
VLTAAATSATGVLTAAASSATGVATAAATTALLTNKRYDTGMGIAF